MSKFSKILLVLTINLLLLVTMFYFMLPVHAADFTVTNTNDSGAGSLRNTIADALLAGGTDVITFDPSLNGQTITLTTGTLVIADQLTIDASALDNSIRVSGNYTSRVFYISSGAAVTLTNLMISEGRTITGVGGCFDYCGGGIFVDFFASLTLLDSLVENNAANSGGAIAVSNFGELVIERSRILNNHTRFEGGGIRADGDTTIRNSAIMSNTSNRGGGGLFVNQFFPAQVISTTIAFNTAVGADGGGISNQGAPLLSIVNSTLAYNRADNGGALALEAPFFTVSGVEVSNSTLTGNQVITDGGAIYAHDIFSAVFAITLTQNTLAGNSSGIQIVPDPSSVITTTLNNTMIVDSTGDNCVNVIGNASNLSDDTTCTGFLEGKARLAPLADNGGPTLTHLPTTGSDAMGNGDATICQSALINGRDQRGFTRAAASCDIGATEVEDTSFEPGITVDLDPPLQVVAAGNSASFTVTVQNAGTVTLTNLAVSESPAISCNYASGVLGDLAVGGTISYTCGLVVISDTVNGVEVEGQALIDNVATGPFVSDTASTEVLVASLLMTKTAYVDGYREVTGPGVFNPSDCALASTITVPVSSTVKYCYTITNTGSYTLSRHTLVDDHMVGAILADFPFTLAPGASLTSVAAGEIPTQTLVITTTNVATWTTALPTLAGALPAEPATINASATVKISGPALDQDGDGYLDNDEGSGDLDDDGIPNYLDDQDGRQVDVDKEIFLPRLGR